MTVSDARPIVAAALALQLGACAQVRETPSSPPDTPLIAAFRTYCIETRTAPEAVGALMSKVGAFPEPVSAASSARSGLNQAWSVTYADHLMVVASGQFLSEKKAGMTSSACSVLDMDDKRSSEGTIRRWLPTYKPGDLSPYPVEIRHREIEPSSSVRTKAHGTGSPFVGYKLSANIQDFGTLLILSRRVGENSRRGPP